MQRVFRPYWEWECFHAGMYETLPPPPMTGDEAKEAYRAFLADLDRFDAAISKVFREWPKSCEQFLTNKSINRIAWIGQASMCIETGVPEVFKSGFALLNQDQMGAANGLAKKRLDQWVLDKRLENTLKNGSLWGTL